MFAKNINGQTVQEFRLRFQRSLTEAMSVTSEKVSIRREGEEDEQVKGCSKFLKGCNEAGTRDYNIIQ